MRVAHTAHALRRYGLSAIRAAFFVFGAAYAPSSHTARAKALWPDGHTRLFCGGADARGV